MFLRIACQHKFLHFWVKRNFDTNPYVKFMLCIPWMWPPPRIPVANEGLQGFPIKNGSCHPGGHWHPVRGPHPMYTLSLYVSWYFSSSARVLLPGGPSGYSKQQLQAPLRVKTAPTPGSKSYLGQSNGCQPQNRGFSTPQNGW